MQERDKQRPAMGKRDIILLVCIFYLLGIVTAIGIYLFWLGKTEAQAEEPELYSELYVADVYIRGDRTEEESKLSKEQNYQLWEVTTVLRSALYQYVKQTNKFPKDLSLLERPFPYNYLSAIPQEPLTFSKVVADTYTGSGGWVYQPVTYALEKTNEPMLKQMIQDILYPNIELGQVKFPDFDPLKIIVNKGKNELWLVSGKIVLQKYPVGLGKNGKTPEGSFQIEEKMMNPNGAFTPVKNNPYGNRALVFAPSFAIHGTNNPESIGNNVSKGCIRMNNHEIAELYAKVPLYTMVEVKEDGPWAESLVRPLYKGSSNSENTFNQINRPKEENYGVFYNWSG
ncbi:L,D-transpeptidase-like protein [Bacillus oleivorans]|uniref:L,D-transpeptidase-like protein n=1 Tax=Bacillus oleivorans TaxID=1448271 RepID=A0A285CH64_9BACI|nr:L,D-transpeptidase [Bacillus oleivorans]SNX66849.1 L,D-transpeptidase-like protein [Bacillus oleivorans]